MAEREWRFCFDPRPSGVWTVGDPPPPPQPPAVLELNDAVRAVIVGTSNLGRRPQCPAAETVSVGEMAANQVANLAERRIRTVMFACSRPF